MSSEQAPSGLLYPFRVEGYAGSDLRVVSFRGREGVSRLYMFDVVLNDPTGYSGHFERDVLGGGACLTLQGEADRHIHGIVRGARLIAGRRRSAGAFFRVKLAPRLWLLSQVRNTRIFQNQSVPEIVAAVLNQHGIEHSWATVRRYKARDYCVQHQETDLHFVRRLLSEEGIYYYFKHPDAANRQGEQLILGDSTTAYAVMPGKSRLPLRDSDARATDEHLRSFEWSSRILTGATHVKEFDFKRPSLDLSGEAKMREDGVSFDESTLRVYDHHGHFEGDDIDKDEAKLHLEQIRRERLVGEGSSICARLIPGHTFELADGPLDDLNGNYVVLRIEHEGYASTAEGEFGGRRSRDPIAAEGESYANRFVCLPEARVARPKRMQWSIQQKMETATVVGPAGEEIYTDEYARIKVQFHWDLQGKRNEHSSCWIRVMQNWSGAGWGFQFIPRIGMEVLVLFVGGDTDKPMVIGCAYNGEHPPPFPLPEQKTISGIRTQSTPRSDGFNELSFEDLVGYERIYMHAQRNLDERVLNDHSTKVGSDQTNIVGANHHETVAGNQTLSVAAARAVTVGATLATNVGAAWMCTVGGLHNMTVIGAQRSHVQGDVKQSVGGAYRQTVGENYAAEIGGNLAFLVEGNQRLQVKGKSIHSFMGDAKAVVKGKHNVAISGKQTVSLGKGSTISINAATELSSTSTLTLQVQEGMKFQCGESSIEILPDQIKISAPKVVVTAGDEAKIRGGKKGALVLNGDAALTGTSAKVAGSGASVSLDSVAKIVGAQVSLGGGGGGSASSSLDNEEDETEEKEWVIQLHQPGENVGDEPKPLANMAVKASGHGPEPFEGSTDGGGVLRLPVVYPKCVIDIEVGDYAIRVNAGSLDDGQEDEAARQRLYNLGYGPGDPDLWDSDEFAVAANVFQRQNKLDTNAGVSAETKGKLKDKAKG